MKNKFLQVSCKRLFGIEIYKTEETPLSKIPFEIVDASIWPEEKDSLPYGSLTEILDALFSLPSNKVIRFLVVGSLIHTAQHLRNAATRKGKKISIAVRGNYIYVGRS
jgi:hypothetical protein